MLKLSIVLLCAILLLSGCAGTIKALFDKDGNLTGAKADSGVEGSLKRNADGSFELTIDNKLRILPKELIGVSGIKNITE